MREIKFRAFIAKDEGWEKNGPGYKPAPRMLSWEELCDGTEDLQMYLTPESSFSNVSKTIQLVI